MDVLELPLREVDAASTYPPKPRRIFLWLGREQRQAALFADRRPRVDFRHRHVLFLERDADGWRLTGYATPDGDLLEKLRRNRPRVRKTTGRSGR